MHVMALLNGHSKLGTSYVERNPIEERLAFYTFFRNSNLVNPITAKRVRVMYQIHIELRIDEVVADANKLEQFVDHRMHCVSITATLMPIASVPENS